MALLEVRQLGKRYEQRAFWRAPRVTHALRDVSFTIEAGGHCELRGAGFDAYYESYAPLVACAPPWMDPEEYCSELVFEGSEYPEFDFVNGDTTCSPDAAAALCVCRRTSHHGPSYLGRSPCTIQGTTMVRGTPPYHREHEFTVDGDYLIRRLIYYPELSLPREEGEPSTTRVGFEMIQRAPAE